MKQIWAATFRSNSINAIWFEHIDMSANGSTIHKSRIWLVVQILVKLPLLVVVVAKCDDDSPYATDVEVGTEISYVLQICYTIWSWDGSRRIAIIQFQICNWSQRASSIFFSVLFRLAHDIDQHSPEWFEETPRFQDLLELPDMREPTEEPLWLVRCRQVSDIDYKMDQKHRLFPGFQEFSPACQWLQPLLLEPLPSD